MALHVRRIWVERALRVTADTFLLTASLVGGVAVWAALAPTEADTSAVFWLAAQRAPLLVACGIAIFHLHGFYTRGRFYRTSYKTVVIAEAVTVAYLAFVALSFLAFPGSPLPRLALIAGWIGAYIGVAGARVWNFVWTRFFRAEVLPTPTVPAPREIENVLVIGGAGYIGSALLPLLLDAGYRVRVLDAMLYGDAPVRDLLTHPRLELIRGDFRDVEAVVRACSGMDAVVHLGGIVGDPACSLDEKLTIDVNLSATRMVAEVARGVGVERFVFASTCSVYGASDEELDEHSQLNPVSLYAKTKIASERLLLELHDANRLPVVLLRFATVFGFSGRIRFDLVVNLLTGQAVKNGVITVRGGEQWRPFVHVADAARAVAAAIAAPRAAVAGEVFNVGSNENNHQIIDVGRMVQSVVPLSELLDLPADGDRRNYRVTFNKAVNRLGYHARWSVIEGIRQVKKAFDDGAIDDWQADAYSNYKSMVSGSAVVARRTVEWESEYLSTAADLPKTGCASLN